MLLFCKKIDYFYRNVHAFHTNEDAFHRKYIHAFHVNESAFHRNSKLMRAHSGIVQLLWL